MKQERTLAERVGLRWPNMAQRTNRWVLRLPPGSRVRGAMLRRAARIGFEAWNRGDLALVAYLDDPEVETHLAQESGVALGFDPVYYGPEGHCRAMELWNEAWRKWEGDIVDVVDQGRDQILVIARVHCEGAASGIRLDEWGVVRYTFRDGLILRVDAAFARDQDRAFEPLTGIAEPLAP